MFNLGDTIVFDPTSFNPDFWDNLNESDRIKYYGDLGYGKDEPVFFSFLFEHKPQFGHCSILNLDNGKIETMRHINNFRLVTDDEC